MLIAKVGENFNDVCHLSEKGKLLLMQSFLPAISQNSQNKRLQNKRSP